MATAETIPAWIALFLGLYSLSAGVGELRAPGRWLAMVEDFEKSPGVMFLTGIVCIGLGATIYLVSPGLSGDWLGILIWVIGGLMVVEGCIFIAAGERFLGFWRRIMGTKMGLWAGASCLLGAALIFVGLSRLQTI